MLGNVHGRGRGDRGREDLVKGPARRDARRDDGRLGASETDRLGREQQRRATAYGRARGRL